ncbi:LLM class flavin-dependent oxidoreductase [Xylophilus sp.]|uniref:LLM class flavin-dependent oxidoreductase n=1 Tax=Xylophilus sp. TaxID=2653893 RepID=UPI0013BD7B96|nr:LLM class flavin-dependent oxidoreductase [Xylophilus sp.]KAF1049176.1 MAG: Alkanesulfonate monooxygenase [Xylophilus sp.]
MTSTTQYHWFISSGGDGRDLAPTGERRLRQGADYLVQVARASERAGFDGVMLPLGAYALDGWLLAAAMAAETTRLRFLVSARPGLELPTLIAQKAATLQRLSLGRLQLNIVVGSSSHDQRAYGDFLEREQRYLRAQEFVAVVRALWRGEPALHAGRFYTADVAGLAAARLAEPPPVFVAGASDLAEQVSSAEADLHALWGETPPMVAERIARLAGQSRAHGRPPVGFALRIHVIARATAAAAWEEAARLLRGLSPQLIASAQQQLARSESVGQARMRALHQGRAVDDVRALEVYPNIWSGVGLVRGGAGTAIVGSYDEVAQRIEEYRGLGVGVFLLSGYPNLEEAAVVGRHVLPRLRGV